MTIVNTTAKTTNAGFDFVNELTFRTPTTFTAIASSPSVSLIEDTLLEDGDTLRLYYGAADPKGGAVEHGPRFYAQPTCHHAPEVYPGIRERDSAALLRSFFAERRG